MDRILFLAPNWLGDAVMSVPSIDAARRRYPSATLAVAARGHLAPLYEMVPGVNEVIALDRPGRFGGWLSAFRDARRLRDRRFDTAVLLPNSFRSAWICRSARIAERWGYASDGRTALLTRAVPRVHGVHQVEYYQRLVDALTGEGRSADAGLPSVALRVPDAAREWARQALTAEGWRPGELLVGLAPGAAYGTAKQWPPDRFAALGSGLPFDGAQGRQAGTQARIVLIGTAADRPVCDAVARAAGPGAINFAGRTDLVQLAAVMAECATFVSNDSGAMHLAAAVGVPVVAIFGSTNEKETSPLPTASGRTHAIVATDISCRPCMLRECPLDGHPCMTGIGTERVREEVIKLLTSSQ